MTVYYFYNMLIRKIFITQILLTMMAVVYGQPVNENISVSLQQAALLRVDAGPDVTLDTEGSAIIGEQVFINGGTPGFTFLWEDDQQQTYEEETPVVSAAGTYRLVITDARHCTAEDNLQVLPNTSLAYSDLLREQVRIGFDASRKTFSIEWHDVGEPLIVTLVSIDGKVADRKEFSTGTGSHRNAFSLGKPERGIYLMVVQSGMKGFTEKFIIQ